MSEPEDSNFRHEYLGEWLTAQPCPECRQGKHSNCTGWALNDQDELVQCPCKQLGHPE